MPISHRSESDGLRSKSSRSGGFSSVHHGRHTDEWLFRGFSIRDSVVRLLRRDTELPAANAVVVVMGPTGAGKSRFIREATGEAVEVGDSQIWQRRKILIEELQPRKKSNHTI
jgi:hypothetical protein